MFCKIYALRTRKLCMRGVSGIKHDQIMYRCRLKACVFVSFYEIGLFPYHRHEVISDLQLSYQRIIISHVLYEYYVRRSIWRLCKFIICRELQKYEFWRDWLLDKFSHSSYFCRGTNDWVRQLAHFLLSRQQIGSRSWSIVGKCEGNCKVICLFRAGKGQEWHW
jgi:hypothetical protein